MLSVCGLLTFFACAQIHATHQYLLVHQQGKIDFKARSNLTPVKTVTVANFKSQVMDNKADVLLEFYAPWCGHCKKLSPEYAKLAEMFMDEGIKTVSFMKVDASKHDLTKQNAKIKVTGYPTLLLFNADDKKNPVTHRRRPAMKQIVQFLKDKASQKFKFDMGVFSKVSKAKSAPDAPKKAKKEEKKEEKKISDDDFDL